MKPVRVPVEDIDSAPYTLKLLNHGPQKCAVA